MQSLNRVTLLGHLGRDAELKYTQSGTARVLFSVATSRRWKDGEEWKEVTDWHSVILWRAEGLAPRLTKGKQVYVEGRLSNRSYEKDGQKVYVTEVVADDVILCGGRREAAVSTPPVVADGPTDEDVPF